MPANAGSRLPAPPATRVGGAVPAHGVTLARDAFGREIPAPERREPLLESDGDSAQRKKPKETATDALGRRAGALADELDFPEFVASLVHGTFDAIVDSSIRQMESYAELVSAVAKPLNQFAQENVTPNQARDWLVEQYPQDIALARNNDSYVLTPVVTNEDDFAQAPAWLADFGFEGESLSHEFLEQTLLPMARERAAQQRLSTLATMVMLGMQRVVVKDGSIGARLRFRAAAADHSAIEYATSDDPGSGVTEWGRRATGRPAVTKVSTVGVNVQSDSELKAEMFGDVKINFASETLPLDRFVNEAQRTVMERHSRRLQPGQQLPAPAQQPPGAATAVQPPQQPLVQTELVPGSQPATLPAGQPVAPAGAPPANPSVAPTNPIGAV